MSVYKKYCYIVVDIDTVNQDLKYFHNCDSAYIFARSLAGQYGYKEVQSDSSLGLFINSDDDAWISVEQVEIPAS